MEMEKQPWEREAYFGFMVIMEMEKQPWETEMYKWTSKKYIYTDEKSRKLT